MLAWIVFLEPMNAMQTWWYVLLLPMAFGISVIYRALRVEEYSTYWRSVVIMTAQVVCGIIALAVGLGIFVQWIIPLLNTP